MLSIVKSMALQGLDGYLVSIQVDISLGLPCFEIVGLPDASVKESKERVRTAIKNTGINFLSRRIVINLAPANTKKEGSIFDLPIAIGVLMATGNINNSILQEFLETTIFIGELSLNGNIEKINGVLPIIIEAKKLGIQRIILPKQNAQEASIIDEIEILPVNNLKEVMDYLNGKIGLKKEKLKNLNLNFKEKYQFDFSEVKGQDNVKKALEISAAGGHNCLLLRKPGLWKNNACKKNAKYFT